MDNRVKSKRLATLKAIRMMPSLNRLQDFPAPTIFVIAFLSKILLSIETIEPTFYPKKYTDFFGPSHTDLASING